MNVISCVRRLCYRILLYCLIFVLSYCYIVVLLYCRIVILLHCYIVLLSYCYIVVLLYCYRVIIIKTTPTLTAHREKYHITLLFHQYVGFRLQIGLKLCKTYASTKHYLRTIGQMLEFCMPSNSFFNFSNFTCTIMVEYCRLTWQYHSRIE